MVEFDEFNEWLEELAVSLGDTSTKPLRVFDRYAEVVHRPSDVTPKNILLDFNPSDFLDGDDAPTGELSIDDRCIDISGNQFTITANGDEFPVAIVWTTRPADISCVAKTSTIDSRAGLPGRVLEPHLS